MLYDEKTPSSSISLRDVAAAWICCAILALGAAIAGPARAPDGPVNDAGSSLAAATAANSRADGSSGEKDVTAAPDAKGAGFDRTLFCSMRKQAAHSCGPHISPYAWNVTDWRCS